MDTFYVFGILLLGVMLCDLIAADLAGDVRNWKTKYLSSQFCSDHKHGWPASTWNDDCTDQIKSAEQKGKAISGTLDIKAAVEIVHIYTWGDPKTYKTVNTLMRGQTDMYLAHSENVYMFETYVDLLKKSYQCLCDNFNNYCKSYEVLFRGEIFYPTVIDDYSFTFRSFISTSEDMAIAQDFADGNIIYVIKGVKGLSLGAFTAAENEYEVLVMPPLEIVLDAKLDISSDQSEIEKRITDYRGKGKIPRFIFEGSVKTIEPLKSSPVNDASQIDGTYIYMYFVVACIILV